MSVQFKILWCSCALAALIVSSNANSDDYCISVKSNYNDSGVRGDIMFTVLSKKIPAPVDSTVGDPRRLSGLWSLDAGAAKGCKHCTRTFYGLSGTPEVVASFEMEHTVSFLNYGMQYYDIDLSSCLISNSPTVTYDVKGYASRFSRKKTTLWQVQINCQHYLSADPSSAPAGTCPTN